MPAATYAELLALLNRAHNVATVAELLGWDEQVNLPTGAAEQRAAQQAMIAELHHALASDGRIGACLADLEGGCDKLTDDQRPVVAQARREYDRATKLPPE